MPSVNSVLADLVDEKGNIDPETSFVMVKNLNDHDVDFMYNSKHWIVKPNQSRIVPYFNMIYYCGDPRAIDVPNDPQRRYRSDEWNRLRIQYGVYENTNSPTHMAMLPKFEVTTQTGERIITVLDDPDGKSMADQTASITDVQAMQEQLAALKIQHDALMQMLDDKQTDLNTPAFTPDNAHRTETPLVDLGTQPIDEELPNVNAEDLVDEDALPPSTTIPTKTPSKVA